MLCRKFRVEELVRENLGIPCCLLSQNSGDSSAISIYTIRIVKRLRNITTVFPLWVLGNRLGAAHLRRATRCILFINTAFIFLLSFLPLFLYQQLCYLVKSRFIQEKIKSRLKSGNACYHLLSSGLLPTNLNIKVYRTIILPVVVYGCETWSRTLRDELG